MLWKLIFFWCTYTHARMLATSKRKMPVLGVQLTSRNDKSEFVYQKRAPFSYSSLLLFPPSHSKLTQSASVFIFKSSISPLLSCSVLHPCANLLSRSFAGSLNGQLSVWKLGEASCCDFGPPAGIAFTVPFPLICRPKNFLPIINHKCHHRLLTAADGSGRQGEKREATTYKFQSRSHPSSSLQLEALVASNNSM